MFLDSNSVLSIIVGVFVGGAAGYLGSFMVLRRMALVGDALSHVALPGIAISLAFGINPFWGAFSFLFLAAVAIWAIGEKTNLPTEAIVGVFFTLSLAVGVLLIPKLELLEALFGDISDIKSMDAVGAVILSAGVFGIAYRMKKASLLGIISRDLAEASKIDIKKTNLIFLILVATVVALGVKVVGTLLMGALVILPAVAAKNISFQFGRFSFLSAAFGVLSAVGGILIGATWHLPPGPIIVLVAVFLFFVSLAIRKVL